MPLEVADRRGLVLPHEPAVAGDVGGENGGEPPFHRGRRVIAHLAFSCAAEEWTPTILAYEASPWKDCPRGAGRGFPFSALRDLNAPAQIPAPVARASDLDFADNARCPGAAGHARIAHRVDSSSHDL